MKKVAVIFVVLGLLVCLILLGGCAYEDVSAAATSKQECSTQCIIWYGTNGLIRLNVKSYVRISSGWIVITDENGTVYSTNEENVLIIKKLKEY